MLQLLGTGAGGSGYEGTMKIKQMKCGQTGYVTSWTTAGNMDANVYSTARGTADTKIKRKCWGFKFIDRPADMDRCDLAAGLIPPHAGNDPSYADFQLLQERCSQLEAQGGVDRRTARTMRAYATKLETAIRMVDSIRHRLKAGHGHVDELKAPCMVIYE